MKNTIKTIMHLYSSSDVLPFIMVGLFLIITIVLLILHKRWKDDKKKSTIWTLLAFIPMLIAIIHIIIFVLLRGIGVLITLYLPIYIPAIVILIMALLSEKIVLFKVMVPITFIAIILCMILSIDTSRVTNFSNKSLKDSYIALCDYFKDNYILANWKKIDFDKLKEDGLVLVEQAESTGDIKYYYDAIRYFVNSTYDGHTGIGFYQDTDYLINTIKSYNDYGLSIIRLSDLRYVAVNVDENTSIYSGIHTGTVITEWDGKKIEDALKDLKLYFSESVLANEEILKPIYLSGTGGESVNVKFIDDEGNEKTVILKKLDVELFRGFETIRLYNNYYMEDENLSTKMLTNNIGYLRISEEQTNVFIDSFAYLTGNINYTKELLRTKISEMVDKGMTSLIIDIRNNGGGYDDVGIALSELFSNEKPYVAYSIGKVEDKKYVKQVSRYVNPDGEFSNIKVVVLTNMRCVSACDGLALYLSKLPNVTLVGLSNTGGFNQENGGLIILPKGIMIYYPTGLVLDGTGKPNIDTNESRVSRVRLDYQIPVLETSLEKLFDKSYDYELDWVIDYINN